MSPRTLVLQEAACGLCRRPDSDPDAYGQKCRRGKLCVHENCLYHASGLRQRGQDEEGFYGFLYPDIRQALKRAAQKACCVCGCRGASVVCQGKKCSRSFHFPCGAERGCISQFFGEFKSFCWKHRPAQRVRRRRRRAETVCVVCLEAMPGRASYSALVCPACKRAWFHRSCIQGRRLGGRGRLQRPVPQTQPLRRQPVPARGRPGASRRSRPVAAAALQLVRLPGDPPPLRRAGERRGHVGVRGLRGASKRRAGVPPALRPRESSSQPGHVQSPVLRQRLCRRQETRPLHAHPAIQTLPAPQVMSLRYPGPGPAASRHWCWEELWPPELPCHWSSSEPQPCESQGLAQRPERRPAAGWQSSSQGRRRAEQQRPPPMGKYSPASFYSGVSINSALLRAV
ncbi:uncharacterized protein LOC112544617 isoform X2 [Pelodiscus sinensis]|uniref:uncharacterized protein LOC112544617 isoform X2 n=1 Tax=Pelodiscus sinensis TaxID=13735 RepID=UPI003F6B5864